jgi:hypothetical protein
MLQDSSKRELQLEDNVHLEQCVPILYAATRAMHQWHWCILFLSVVWTRQAAPEVPPSTALEVYNAMDLAARAAMLKAERQQLQQDMKVLARSSRKRHNRLELHGANSMQRLVVLLVHALSNNCLELAAHCWCMQRQHRGCKNEDTTLQTGRRITNAWVDATTSGEWDVLLHSTHVRVRQATVLANRFIADATTAGWALRVNCEKGHAPTTEQAWNVRLHSLPTSSQTVHERSAFTVQASQKRWGHKWRQAWLFKYTKIRLREYHRVEDVREKAGRAQTS